MWRALPSSSWCACWRSANTAGRLRAARWSISRHFPQPFSCGAVCRGVAPAVCRRGIPGPAPGQVAPGRAPYRLATLARPQGILLMLPLVVAVVTRARVAAVWPRWRERGELLAAAGLPVAALAGFTAYLHGRFGSWTAIANAQD